MAQERFMFFLSVIEEWVNQENYPDYMGGRIEVYSPDNQYASEEIRYFTKKKNEFLKFRRTFDFLEVSPKWLEKVREKVEREFQEYSDAKS